MTAILYKHACNILQVCIWMDLMLLKFGHLEECSHTDIISLPRQTTFAAHARFSSACRLFVSKARHGDPSCQEICRVYSSDSWHVSSTDHIMFQECFGNILACSHLFLFSLRASWPNYACDLSSFGCVCFNVPASNPCFIAWLHCGLRIMLGVGGIWGNN